MEWTFLSSKFLSYKRQLYVPSSFMIKNTKKMIQLGILAEWENETDQTLIFQYDYENPILQMSKSENLANR